MAFMIDEAFLPATLTVPPMDDAQFAEFCSEHPDLFFEMTAEGELIVMPPNFSMTSARNREITSQLDGWAKRDGTGIVTDPSGGFVLPNGARRSPDAAWTPDSRLARLSEAELEAFWHLCPAFVIELRSHSDRLRTLREKMKEWIANGAELAWLIDPDTRSVEIYRPGKDPEILTNADSAAADGPVKGFVLDLKPVWDPRRR